MSKKQNPPPTGFIANGMPPTDFNAKWPNAISDEIASLIADADKTTPAGTSASAELIECYLNGNKLVNPPVICNPQATPAELLAWCLEEVTALHLTAEVMSLTSDVVVNNQTLTHVFCNRLESVTLVLEAAIDKLLK